MALVAGDDAGRPPPIPAAGGGRAPAPQIIGHRGYKAAFPENSMAAFQGAVEVGAHAIETDLHLSRDGVVVLSHVSNHPAPVSRRPATHLVYCERIARRGM